MARLQQIHRCTHCEVDCGRRCAVERPTTIFLTRAHALARRMRKIVACQVKFLAQTRVESLERCGEFFFDPLPCDRFFQFRKMRNGSAETDPNWRPPNR